MSEAFEKENTPAAVLSSQQVATPPSLQKSNSRSPLVGETSKIQCSSPLYKKQKTSEGYSKPEQRDKSDSPPLAVSELSGVAKFLKSRGFQTDSIGTVPNDGRFEDLKEMLLEKVAELKSLPICRNISPIDWSEIERCYSHSLASYVKETQEINEELEICFNERMAWQKVCLSSDQERGADQLHEWEDDISIKERNLHMIKADFSKSIDIIKSEIDKYE